MANQGASLQPEALCNDRRRIKWRPATRTTFRFFFLYFILYVLFTQLLSSLFPIPSVSIPDLSTLAPMRQIVLWTGAHIFHIASPMNYTDTGSGDRAFDWVLLFCEFMIALMGTVLWSILDRSRPNYTTLCKWLRLTLRIVLAGQVFSYGMMKVIPLQMPFPSLARLAEPLGNFSPMGVLWFAIGASPAYEMFAGCAELLAGVLLIIPRTSTLGALVCLADMTQVFMLNMTYDVPVKLLSFHLWSMSLFLLAPELKRLVNFFFLNELALPSTQLPVFDGRRANRIGLIVQLAIGCWLLGMNVWGGWVGWHQYGGGAPKSPLYGIWNVDRMMVDGQVRLPLLNDYGRWRRVIFDGPTLVSLQRMDDSFGLYLGPVDAENHSVSLVGVRDRNSKGTFTFDRPAEHRLTLDGSMDSHKVHLELQLLDRNEFLLTSRGFHWVQEKPFNR